VLPKHWSKTYEYDRNFLLLYTLTVTIFRVNIDLKQKIFSYAKSTAVTISVADMGDGVGDYGDGAQLGEQLRGRTHSS
jgi:hypothetical protein